MPPAPATLVGRAHPGQKQCRSPLELPNPDAPLDHLGKTTFHLIGQDERGAIVMRAKVSRRQLTVKLSNLPACIIGMEPCSGAHYIARRLLELGHDFRLVPGQYVKPFLKAHKNDYRDAEAVAEAVQRPTMDFVSVKTPDQSDLLSLASIELLSFVLEDRTSDMCRVACAASRAMRL